MKVKTFKMNSKINEIFTLAPKTPTWNTANCEELSEKLNVWMFTKIDCMFVILNNDMNRVQTFLIELEFHIAVTYPQLSFVDDP